MVLGLLLCLGGSGAILWLRVPATTLERGLCLALLVVAGVLAARLMHRQQRLTTALHQLEDQQHQSQLAHSACTRALALLQELARALETPAGENAPPPLQALASILDRGLSRGPGHQTRITYGEQSGQAPADTPPATFALTRTLPTPAGHELRIECHPGGSGPASDEEKQLLATAATLLYQRVAQFEYATARFRQDALFFNLFDHAPVPLLLFQGTPPRTRAINRRFTELLGYTLADLPDEATLWKEAFPDFFYGDEVRSAWAQQLEETRRAGRPSRPIPVQFTCKNRSLRHLEITTALVKETHLLFCQDITENKTQAEALRRVQMDLEQRVLIRTLELQHINHSLEAEVRERKRSESRLQALTTALPEIAFILDRDGRFEEILSVYSPVPGRPPEVLRGHLLSEVFTPEIAATFTNTVQQALQTRKTQSIDYVMASPAGARWFEGRAAPLVLDEGSRHLVIFIVRNVTERKRTEQAIKDNEARLRAIFEASNTGFFFRHPDGTILFANDAYARLLGRDRTELIGINYTRLFSAEVVGMESAFLEEIAMRQRESYRFEKAVPHPSGQPVWIDLSVTAVRDDQQQPRYFVGVASDITERRNAQQQLEATLLDLKRSNRDLEQFAYIASHDLQEPLRLVSSYVQLLARRYRSQLDAEADEFIGYAVDGAQRMQDLIQALLAYSRVGRQPRPFTPVDCQQVLAQVRTNLGFALAEAHATLTADPLPTVLGDATLLGQLLQNLIANAIKFHREEAPLVHLEALRPAGSAYWQIGVRDNGIGIAAEFHERIFEIFQRLHTRRQYAGSGIGLSICKKIVELHGGKIWLESVPQQGTTFFFILPAVEPA